MEIARKFVPRLNKFSGFNIKEDYDELLIKITFDSILYSRDPEDVLKVFREMIKDGAVVIGWDEPN